jgi:hypothetical protein
MNKKLAVALSSIAAGWLALPALAQSPNFYPTTGTVIVQGEQIGAPKTSGPAGMPAAAPAPTPAPAASHGPITTVNPTWTKLPHGHPEWVGVGAFPAESLGCDHCGNRGGFLAGIGFYYVKPHWETNPAYTAVNNLVGGGNPTVIRAEEFDYDYDFAPLIWIGYTNAEDFGVRLRHWRLDFSQGYNLTNDGLTGIDSAAPLGLQNLSTTLGDQLAFESDLNIQVWDAELIQGFQACNWNFLLAGGVRYVHLSQSYNHFELPDNGVGNTLVDGGTSGHQIKGFGPTLAVEVRRPVGMGLSVYGSARGSVIFGEAKQRSFQMVNNLPSTIANSDRDDLLPISEYEIGAEFNREMSGMRFFAQAALVGQVWYGAGNAANNEMIPVLVDPEVSDNSSNLGLFGLRFAIGVNY